MSLSFEEVNILGNLINDTFGKGSTGHDEQGKNYSAAVTKASMSGDCLYITSLVIANLGPIHSQHHEILKHENELNQRIKKYLSDVCKEFKRKENAGRVLKTKVVDGSEVTDVSMINHYAATRQAYVKRTICFRLQ